MNKPAIRENAAKDKEIRALKEKNKALDALLVDVHKNVAFKYPIQKAIIGDGLATIRKM